MVDIIGPVLVIILIFGIYYAAQHIDSLGDIKRGKIDLDKITAETRREEIAVRKRELEVEMGRLAIEAKKLEQLDYKPGGTVEAEFEVLKELEDKRKKK